MPYSAGVGVGAAVESVPGWFVAKLGFADVGTPTPAVKHGALVSLDKHLGTFVDRHILEGCSNQAIEDRALNGRGVAEDEAVGRLPSFLIVGLAVRLLSFNVGISHAISARDEGHLKGILPCRSRNRASVTFSRPSSAVGCVAPRHCNLQV